MERETETKKVLWIVLILNLVVTIGKFVFGILANSISMIADAVHSLFDTTSNIIGLVAISISSKPPDHEHPYGHRKYEMFATVLIAALLLLTGFEIMESSIRRILKPVEPNITSVTFFIMSITLVINFFVSRYEHKKGESLNSSILVADSMHTRSDVYASLAVILGFLAVKSGYPIMDPLIAVFVVSLILKTGYNIMKGSSAVLVDRSVIDPRQIIAIAKSVEGVKSCHRVRSRGTKKEAYIDLHIRCKSDTHIDKAHNISHRVEKKLKKEIKGICDITVHIEPEK